MTDGNMICPRCKAFQQRAETCRECGVIVAKLWQQRAQPDEPAGPVGGGGGRRGLYGGIAIAALLVVAAGAWQLAGDDGDGGERDGSWVISRGIGAYIEAARDAQSAAERAREQMEAAVLAAETGNAGYGTTGYFQPGPASVDVDLDRLAAEMNAVSTVSTVTLTGADLEATVNRCLRFADRYFRALRFGAAERYPLTDPTTRPVVAGELDGRFRCDGPRGTVYSHSKPQDREGLSTCWRKQDPERQPRRNKDEDIAPALWVQMQWDEEAEGWSVYSRADQRSVDRTRLQDARTRVGSDIERAFGRRETRARESFPALIARIEELRDALRIAGNETLRRSHGRALDENERRLRAALVEHRHNWLCRTAADAALDAREEALDLAAAGRR